MPFIDISKDDIDRGKLITPDWYRVKIDRVESSLSKNGDSTNYIVKGNLLFNATNGNEEFKGVPVPYWNFNSKAPGFVVGFFAALGEEVKPGRLSFDVANGKEIEVFISNELYNNSMVNRINHQYRTPRNGQ